MNASSHAIPTLVASAISVDFDLTFLAQFVLFAAFLTLLKPLLFDPLLKVFEERERRTDGAKKEARAMDEAAGQLIVRYEGELQRVRHEAGVEREKLRAETAKLEARILAEGREEATRILEAGKAQIATEIAELSRKVDLATPDLARQIASRVLNREVPS